MPRNTPFVKGYLRIGGAFLLGAVIIAVGVYLRPTNIPSQGVVQAVTVPERQYIPSQDTDNNGVPDWEDALQKKIFETTPDPAPVVTEASGTQTYTDKFARSFFEDFMKEQLPGSPPKNKDQFVKSAVSSIEQDAQSRLYTNADITMTETTNASLHEYGNAIAGIIISYTTTENKDPGLILSQALNANDPTKLDELAPIKAVYKHSLKDTLLVPVPNSVVTEHLHLLDAYQAMLDDIDAMQLAFADPLYALARLKRYEDDSQGFYQSYVNMSNALKKAGAAYTDDEPGVLFKYFETS